MVGKDTDHGSRNYFNQKNIELMIGYFSKGELENKYPSFEKITCKS